jgi:hypothetical protein
MATQVPTSSEPGFAHLLRGIANDMGDLVKQQIQFARAEIKEDLRKSKEACVLLALGAGSALAGVLFLGLMLVHLLHWLTAPAHTDPSSLPLWGCHAIVAGVFTITGKKEALNTSGASRLWIRVVRLKRVNSDCKTEVN